MKKETAKIKKPKKTKPLLIKCACLGGATSCGALKVIDYGDGDFEIQSTNNEAIYLTSDRVSALIGYLKLHSVI